MQPRVKDIIIAIITFLLCASFSACSGGSFIRADQVQYSCLYAVSALSHDFSLCTASREPLSSSIDEGFLAEWVNCSLPQKMSENNLSSQPRERKIPRKIIDSNHFVNSIPRGGWLLTSSSYQSPRVFASLSKKRDTRILLEPPPLSIRYNSRTTTSVKMTNFASASMYVMEAPSSVLPCCISFALSAFLGMLWDNRVLNGSGPMITLLASRSISKMIDLNPSASHFVSNLCWMKFLPASLALILLSPTSSDSVENTQLKNHSQKEVKNEHHVVESESETSSTRDELRKELGAVSVPFIFGVLGSVLGCMTSFLLCILGANNPYRLHRRIFPGRRHFFWLPGHLLLQPREAAVAAGCLCASYIGGSVNFFETARTMSTDAHFLALGGEDGAMNVIGSLLGSSAADILVMALYLSSLSAAPSCTLLRTWFPGRGSEDKVSSQDNYSDELVASQPFNATSFSNSESSLMEKTTESAKQKIGVLSFVVPVSWIIVELSNRLQRFVQESFQIPAPGLACVCTVVLGSLARRILHTTLRTRCRESSIKHSGEKLTSILKDVSSITQTMSGFCFQLLFAAIGSASSLSQAIRCSGWHSTSSFIFSGISLLVHIIVITFGSLAVENIFPSIEVFPLGIDEVIVASTAAVSGPITAATFASEIGRRLRVPQRRRELIMAATFWGIVGYAIATGIGVALSRFLLRLIPSSLG